MTSHAIESGNYDWLNSLRKNGPLILILLTVISLTLLGLTALYSVSQADSIHSRNLMMKQICWIILAITLGSLTYTINLDNFRKYAWLQATVIVTLLLLVLYTPLGVKVNGAQRWLNLPGIRIQVSEFAKIGLIFLLAHYLASNHRNIKKFTYGFIYPLAIVGTFFGLIFIQPDMGTAILIGSVSMIMLFFAGVRKFHLLIMILLAATIFITAVSKNPERLDRISAFIDIDSHRTDGAHQLWQGILALGLGGEYGTGLGIGRQKLAYIPEAHTDFIFSVIGEELGFAATAGIVLTYLAIFIICILQLPNATNMFQYILMSGAVLIITLQALFNLGVVTGCLPTKGIPLPFISYGGSNIAAMSILVGIILNCIRNWSHKISIKHFEI